MKIDCQGVNGFLFVLLVVSGDFSIFIMSVVVNGLFNNMGVLGVKMIIVVYLGYGNFVNGFGNYNLFFMWMLMLVELLIVFMLFKLVVQNVIFFLFFLGNNDVFSYVFSGGISDVIILLVGLVGVGFDVFVDFIVFIMMVGGVKGVIVNVLDIISILYFIIVFYNGFMLNEI